MQKIGGAMIRTRDPLQFIARELCKAEIINPFVAKGEYSMQKVGDAMIRTRDPLQFIA
jgi:hypothetical protein